MSFRSSWSSSDLDDMERESGLRSFALDGAWAEAAVESHYAEPLRAGYEEGGMIRALALGLRRRRAGFSKIVCGTNGTPGIIARDPDAASHLLEGLRRRWRPSVLQVFLSSSLQVKSFEWEPAYSFRINLGLPPETIKGRFAKSTRKSLARAIRNGVTARLASSSQDVGLAFGLIEEVSRIKKFPLPPHSYLAAIHSSFKKSGISELVVASRGSQALAVVHLIGARGTAFWWKGGASSLGYRLNASLVAHWKAIEIAKEHGLEWYDLGGTNPLDPAYTRIHDFKSSFGGDPITTAVGTYSTRLARSVNRLRSV